MGPWVEASETKRYHEALLYAIVSYLLSREYKDAQAEHNAITMMNSGCVHIVEALLEKRKEARKGQTACSFCGKTEPDITLAAGPHAFICNECVATFSEVFQQKN